MLQEFVKQWLLKAWWNIIWSPGLPLGGVLRDLVVIKLDDAPDPVDVLGVDDDDVVPDLVDVLGNHVDVVVSAPDLVLDVLGVYDVAPDLEDVLGADVPPDLDWDELGVDAGVVVNAPDLVDVLGVDDVVVVVRVA